jgi:hypothetical protein
MVESGGPGEVTREQFVGSTSQAANPDTGHFRRSAIMSFMAIGAVLVGGAILLVGVVLLLVFGLKK